MITVIAIGKKHESWVDSGIERYQTRLVRPYDVTWRLLPHSSLDELAARREESLRILGALSERDFVILLDEKGKALDSPTFSKVLEHQFTTSRPIVFVIGGAYGVAEELFARADLAWSLSALVFPHQLVRLILIEQLYRAQSIARGSSYHHA